MNWRQSRGGDCRMATRAVPRRRLPHGKYGCGGFALIGGSPLNARLPHGSKTRDCRMAGNNETANIVNKLGKTVSVQLGGTAKYRYYCLILANL